DIWKKTRSPCFTKGPNKVYTLAIGQQTTSRFNDLTDQECWSTPKVPSNMAGGVAEPTLLACIAQYSFVWGNYNLTDKISDHFLGYDLPKEIELPKIELPSVFFGIKYCIFGVIFPVPEVKRGLVR
ncbi:MAG: hypothetical protein ACRCSI_02485, partial [Eubacterium aggregans]